MLCVLLICLALWLKQCDVVTTHFATREAMMERQDLSDLAACLPASATNIRFSLDVENNRFDGDFTFAHGDTAFIALWPRHCPDVRLIPDTESAAFERLRSTRSMRGTRAPQDTI